LHHASRRAAGLRTRAARCSTGSRTDSLRRRLPGARADDVEAPDHSCAGTHVRHRAGRGGSPSVVRHTLQSVPHGSGAVGSSFAQVPGSGVTTALRPTKHSDRHHTSSRSCSSCSPSLLDHASRQLPAQGFARHSARPDTGPTLHEAAFLEFVQMTLKRPEREACRRS